MKKDSILITGADGALGKILMNLFESKKINFIPLVKTKNSKIKNSIICDITNFDKLNKIIIKLKPTIIIHLASITGNFECEHNPELTFKTNIFGTYNILEACKEIKPKIIFASSREVYGNSTKKLSENNKLFPININGLTKKLSESIIINFNKTYRIPYIILRFTNFYGEDYSKRGISKMIKSAMEGKQITVFGGQQKIDLIHHHDAALAISKTLRIKKSGIYNIGLGKSITILQLIREIEKLCGIKVKLTKKPYRMFEVKNFKIDVSKAKKELNFKPALDHEHVLKKMHTKWALF